VTWEEATRPPDSASVLHLVSPRGASDLPTWVAHPSLHRLRQHVLALDVSRETFRNLASLCSGECWHLDAFVRREGWAEFIVEFIASREIDIVQVLTARLGVDLAPTLRAAYPSIGVVVDVDGAQAEERAWLDYVTSRYGNVIDAFCTTRPEVAEFLGRVGVSASRVHRWESSDAGRDAAAAAMHRDVYGYLLASSVR
jgi:hypothetical protein